jgi:alpha,alpha-trehalase
MKANAARCAILAWTVLLLAASQGAAKDLAAVQIELFSGHPQETVTVRDGADLAPALEQCLFESGEPRNSRISPRTFALQCVVPYIHGLWLDPTVLYRSRADIVEQATDRLIEHPAGRPFPIFYPPRLEGRILDELRSALRDNSSVVPKPLPDPLPEPSLDPASLYNNVGLLYLPNPYVVPGDTFNEMYGWDSFFIVEGLLASVDYIMANPTARVWSPTERSFLSLSTRTSDANYYRSFAEKLFQTAKGMVDNHVFEIEYYGGFVLNANRTYYLTRSQPPLFTREAVAVLDRARRYGFEYIETLAPYLSLTRSSFTAPQSYGDWSRIEVLPAARDYYAYWTDPGWAPPTRAPGSSGRNPRVVSVDLDGTMHPVYRYATSGIGPAPEVARSTQPQNRALYQDDASYFKNTPAENPDRLFYNPAKLCKDNQAVGNCGDPIYHLTQAYYAADRAIRASGFDLSGRFGNAGQWAMNYAPISLNVLLLRMAEDIDQLSSMAGQTPPNGQETLRKRRQFLARYFALESNGGYADRLMQDNLPKDLPRFAYPYATQFYLLWADVLGDADNRAALLRKLQAEVGGSAFLAPLTVSQFGIPTSLSNTGKQWDAPFAWAPIQYFAVSGLISADFPSEATVAMQQWIAAVNAYFAKTGVLIEKYDSRNPTSDPRVRIGYAQTQRGFGWTNAVYMLFINRLYEPF